MPLAAAESDMSVIRLWMIIDQSKNVGLPKPLLLPRISGKIAKVLHIRLAVGGGLGRTKDLVPRLLNDPPFPLDKFPTLLTGPVQGIAGPIEKILEKPGGKSRRPAEPGVR